jgi:uncharacterized membrane protein YhiD involved in acid resistance
MISIHFRDLNPSANADPARICAQVVSGMGFLGSATIFKNRNYVKGINTAANLWISAAVSMSIGAGLWELGAVTAFCTLGVLMINNRYKNYVYGKKRSGIWKWAIWKNWQNKKKRLNLIFKWTVTPWTHLMETSLIRTRI